MRLTFEDTLTQIGLGYFFLYLLALRSRRAQWIALSVILAAYWLAFALYPLPGPDFDWQSAGVPQDWAFNLKGFAAHWNKNTNLAWRFDTWFLNLFPHMRTFTNNAEGYTTRSFIPTVGTMILGLLACGILKGQQAQQQKLVWFAISGVSCIAIGLCLHLLGVVPIVKRIWTPSWVLFSGGWCLLILMMFHVVIDFWGKQAWAMFLIIPGMNSIIGYVMAYMTQQLDRLLAVSNQSPELVSIRLMLGTAIIFAEWLVLWWLYRRRIFIRI
jgi:predicted acyltransferase